MIAVVIPSRGRPLSLKGVAVSLFSLSSSNASTDISYTVVCDDDDPKTEEAAHELKSMLGDSLTIAVAPRALVSNRVNDVARVTPAKAYVLWPDDCFPLASQWDRLVNTILHNANVPAFAWQEVADPENHTLITFSETWFKCVWRLVPEHFPFWFGDSWQKEVFMFAFGHPMPIVSQLSFGGKRLLTLNMHDLKFWFDVFEVTRNERLTEAKGIAEAFGRSMPDPKPFIEHYERIYQLQLGRIPIYEKAFGAGKGVKSKAYEEAKQAAEKLINQRDLVAA